MRCKHGAATPPRTLSQQSGHRLKRETYRHEVGPGKASKQYQQYRSLTAWATNQVQHVVGEDAKSQRSHPGWIRIAGSRGGPETDKTGQRMKARCDEGW